MIKPLISKQFTKTGYWKNRVFYTGIRKVLTNEIYTKQWQLEAKEIGIWERR